jgi:hypothetical protein
MFHLKHPSFLPSADVKPISNDLVLAPAVYVFFIVHIKIVFVVHLKHSSFLYSANVKPVSNYLIQCPRSACLLSLCVSLISMG